MNVMSKLRLNIFYYKDIHGLPVDHLLLIVKIHDMTGYFLNLTSDNIDLEIKKIVTRDMGIS